MDATPADPSPSPLADAARWPEVVDSVGVPSLLVVIHQRMGARLRASCTAEDIWQQTLAHAWRDRTRFRWDGIARFRAWLLAIANHRIQDELDKLSAGKRAGDASARHFSEMESPSGSISSFLPGITNTPERLAYYRERAQMMRDALAALPPELEVFVRRHLFDEEPIEAIGESIGVPRSTAFARFRKGSELYARRLRDLLASSGGEQPLPP
jgi:RNA polymerase sigma factor (sigma-70 family)